MRGTVAMSSDKQKCPECTGTITEHEVVEGEPYGICPMYMGKEHQAAMFKGVGEAGGDSPDLSAEAISKVFEGEAGDTPKHIGKIFDVDVVVDPKVEGWELRSGHSSNPKPQPQQSKTCPTCKGSGRYRTYRRYRSFISKRLVEINITCPDCKGTGQIPEKKEAKPSTPEPTYKENDPKLNISERHIKPKPTDSLDELDQETPEKKEAIYKERDESLIYPLQHTRVLNS